MAGADVETIARLYAGHLSDPRRNADPDILRFFDSDVVIEQDESFLGTQGTFRGYEGLVRSAAEIFELFDEIHFVVEELIDAGEGRVLAMVVAHARGKGSGLATEKPVAHLWRLRDGRVVSWRVFLDRRRAREEAGVGGAGP